MVSEKLFQASFLIIFSAIVLGVGVLLLGSVSTEVCDFGGNASSGVINLMNPGAAASQENVFRGSGENTSIYLTLDPRTNITSAVVNVDGNNEEIFEDPEEINNGVPGENVGKYNHLIGDGNDAYMYNLHNFHTSDLTGGIVHSFSNATGRWFNETVTGTTGGEGLSLSPYLTSGSYYLSYQNASGYLHVVQGNTGVWTWAEVDTTNNQLGNESGIYARSATQIMVAYYDAANEDLKVAYYNGTWQNKTLYSNGNVGRFPKVTFFNSFFKIIFINETTGNLMVWSGDYDTTNSLNTIYGGGDVDVKDYNIRNDCHQVKVMYTANGNIRLAGGSSSYIDSLYLDKSFEMETPDFYCTGNGVFPQFTNYYVVYRDSTNNYGRYYASNPANAIVYEDALLTKIAPTGYYPDIVEIDDPAPYLSYVTYVNNTAAGNQMNLKGKGFIYGPPVNPCLDVANDGTCNWNFVGGYTGDQTTGDFAATLNNELATCGGTACNITMKLNSTARGGLVLDNLNVNWSINNTGCLKQDSVDLLNASIDALGEFGTWFALFGAALTVLVVSLVFNKLGGEI